MKKKSINERIQEELQYTEEINKKIKKIEQKTYKKKEQIKSKKNNFEFSKEIKYLREQQRKIENELCIQLYDISNGKDDELMSQFYFMMNFERDVSRDFYKILDILKKNQNELKNNESLGKEQSLTLFNKKQIIDGLFTTLKTFNQNLITITKEDYDNLDITLSKDNTDDKETSIDNSSNDIIDLISSNDCFNILSISDIDYLISQELSQAEQINSLLYLKEKPMAFSINQVIKNTIKESLFNLPPISYSINKSLEEKALITFGEEQGREMLKQINNSFELAIMKYKTDYNKLVSSLKKEIVNITKKEIPTKIKLKCGNMLFFIKNVDNKLSFNQRLLLDNTLPSYNQSYQLYYNFLEFLYSFKSKQKSIISSYNSEINDLKSTSSKLLSEEINETIIQRKKQIAQYEFDIRKQEMKTQHMKNKEIYDIKEKIKNEKKKINDELQKREKEKLEQDRKMRDEKNKILSENYIKQKKIKEEAEQETLKREQEILNQKEKEEINLKLPQIIQRQIRSTEQFITQQKKKEIEKSKKEYDQQRLNEIVENYKTRPQVEADPERLIAITQNLQNKYETIYHNKMDEGDKAKLFSNNGFTVENLMKDFRYKVSSALFEAGFIDKDYSNQMLKEVNNLHCMNNTNVINNNATTFI